MKPGYGLAGVAVLMLSMNVENLCERRGEGRRSLEMVLRIIYII